MSNSTRPDKDLADGRLQDKVSNTININQTAPSSVFEKITRIFIGQAQPKQASSSGDGLSSIDQSNEKKNATNSTATSQQQPVPKRSCRAPPSRRFAHPCSCSQSNSNHKSHSAHNHTGAALPLAAFSPILLYDSATKKCLPTSRNRDMLLKECRSTVATYQMPNKLYHGTPCVYDDLVCDARRNRCVCKPSLHLFYESSANYSAFGCVPISSATAPSGRACKSGYVYNVITTDCQRIFDVNELPPNQTTGVSATQFSFVTIVLIWLLLFILIATTKLRKCRNPSLYANSPATERRLHRGGPYRPQSQGSTTTWLHPFIAAMNGHPYLSQHRASGERRTHGAEDSGNFSDTDFFLSNGNRRLNELFADGTFAGSQHSLNNPPPKFEEIYPSCPEEQTQQLDLPINMPHQHPPPPSAEDLPTYDEAMKLQNTAPLGASRKG